MELQYSSINLDIPNTDNMQPNNFNFRTTIIKSLARGTSKTFQQLSAIISDSQYCKIKQDVRDVTVSHPLGSSH